MHALKPCRACRAEISPRARQCPACGNRKRMEGTLWLWLLGVAGACFALYAFAPQQLPRFRAPKWYEPGKSLKIGGLSYYVTKATWGFNELHGTRLTLGVQITNVTESRKAVPAMTVVDGRGLEYWPDEGAAEIALLESLGTSRADHLNPKVWGRRLLVFPMPADREGARLGLMVRGGTYSPARAVLEIQPPSGADAGR